MEEIFQVIYKFLKWISKLTRFTYHEVNVIVYFIIIPSLFVFLLSKIYKRKSIIIGYSITIFVIIALIPDFKKFSTEVFLKCVDFLNWFQNFGLSYSQASVIICVIIPVLIIFLLIYRNKRTK